jgi:non-ribosomal peptide synthetase-like protein
MPDDVLLGVCTVADDTRIRPGTSWFGHPSFELPRREVVECDRSFTHEPTPIRYLNRLIWELLRFAIPVVPVLVLPIWFKLLADAERGLAWPLFLFAAVPLLSLGMGGFFCLLVLLMKWGLLGRVRPGTHPLWSCWCSRWDFVYVAWAFYARTALTTIEGTLWLTWYLRAMGMQIGRRVVLGSGFAHVVDPDMLHFEDDATVSCQFQAHTFEDRVLKIDHVWIRRGATVGNNAVLLYGADIGARARVAPHSVVMKRESLLAGRSYAGCPTRPVPEVQKAMAACGD